MAPKLFLTTCVLSALFLFAGAFRGPFRSLLNIPSIEDVRTSCQSSASTSLVITGGTGSARSTSSCTAFASSIDDIEEIVNDYIETVETAPADACTTVRVEEVLDACAQAIAKVYTEASADIEIQGNGRGCAEASSEGDAYATAYSALLVNLWLGVTDGDDSAEAEAQVGSLNFALAKAWAEAKASVCHEGSGAVGEFESSFADQVRVAITCVSVELAAKLCSVAAEGTAEGGPCDTCGAGGELEELFTETESTSEVGVCSSTYDLVNETGGNAATENREVDLCTGAKEECCDAFYDDKSECLCGRDCTLQLTEGGVWLDSTDNSLCSCAPDEILESFEDIANPGSETDSGK